MNNKGLKTILRGLLIITAFASISGCASYLDNPLKDKETGEDINLLVLDFNFFDTRISVKLKDAKDGSLLTAPATISFSGMNGNDIVTFTGEKKTDFSTAQGQLEVTVDPNVSVSENSPLQFAINVQAEGYNSVSQGIQYKSTGKKTIELELVKTEDEEESEYGGDIGIGDDGTSIIISAQNNQQLKSAQVEQLVRIEYEISIASFLKFRDKTGKPLFNSSEELLEIYNADQANFLKLTVNKFTSYSPVTDVLDINGQPVSALFHKLETGRLTKLVVAGKEVADLNGGVIISRCTYLGMPAPDLFGFAVFSTDRWNFTGTKNVYSALGFSYTVAKASTEPLCPMGSRITFRSEAISSFSIDADVYDNENKLLTTVSFKGNFPETFAVENTPQKAVKLVFRNNNPAFQPIAPLEISDFCSGTYEVQVTPNEGYTEYQIVLRAFCPDSPTIAVAPTYSGEYKIKGAEGPWQGADMTGGVVDLLGLPGQEYEYRLLWENEWEYSTLVTEFDENGNYVHPSGSDIHSERIDDGRIRIYVDHKFSQSVCDDLGW
ncbi:hypothetical protein SAMN05444274_11113 [Mariniphaga anaerophila]|uniref:Uncharacterized protein n=1 Tax=Mariniphaga anaerophila TaxID=1484053 RepID=A0A1M5F5F6_9BACT|nr:hypothetical protein [Mariniphaga anaerophila]SHF86381.1 hypothetical protein SAMN05444274_11113 [Mariniphaga anaerophila]